MKRNFHLCQLVDADKCKGCTNCVKVCPTEAIRVRKGTAVTLKERCINCGTCIRTCPYHAKIAITDPLDIKKLQEFKCTIALVSPALYAQFGDKVSPGKILHALGRLGFDMVFEESVGAEAYTIAVREYLKTPGIKKPLISSACPSAIKLVKLRFPNLIDHIIPILSPMEIAAKLVRDKVSILKNIPEDQIGIFLITPCVAKYIAIKQPVGISKSHLDGAISLLHIYGKIINEINDAPDNYNYPRASASAVGYAKSGGETAAVNARNYLVADGLRNVISLFEEMDMGSFNNVDYIECRVCHGGSIGGPLTYQNPFLARIAIRNLVKKLPVSLPAEEIDKLKKKYHEGYFNNTKKIEALPFMPIHPNIEKAIELVAKSEEILKQLPALDCGSCGTPSCRALAEDVALGRAALTDCIFKMLERIEHSAQSTLNLLHKANRFEKKDN